MSPLWLPQDQAWRLDVISALIGAGITAVIAITLYRLRAEIGRAVQVVRERVSHARERLAMGARQRYREWITGRLAALHVLHEGATLPELYIAPEFVTPQPHPAVSAQPSEPPPPTVPLATVLKATKRVIVTGIPGSGRSACLAHIGRIFAQDDARQAFGLEEHRLPIYLHLAELALEPEQSSSLLAGSATLPDKTKAGEVKAPSLDPARPLVDSVTSRLPLLLQAGTPGLLRNYIKEGEVVLLLDGLDEMDAEVRSRALKWLAAFSQADIELRIVVAASPAGNAPLLDAGFVEIPLAPWTSTQVAHLAERWAQAAKGGEGDAARLAAILKPVPGTSPLPVDVTLAAFVWQKRGSVPPNRAAAYGQTVDLLLENVQATSPLSPMLARAAMGRLALEMSKDNRHTVERAEIEKLVVELLPPPPSDPRKATDAKSVPLPSSPATQPDQETSSAGGEPPAPGGLRPAEPPKPKGVPESVEALLKCGLLIERGRDRFAFVHRRVASYLAAWQITQTAQGALLAQHMQDLEWSDVFEFCAGLVNIAPLVDVLLKQEDDLFRSRLWTIAGWAASAGPDLAWRGKVLVELAGQFMQPNQLPPLRERALMALLSTQDKGLGYLFKQATSSPEPLVRAQAARGLGMLGRDQDLITLDTMLKDPDEPVREAAVRAMGAIGGQAGIEHLVNVLLEADEALRKVAAVTLVECGQEGLRILKEAVREEDMLVRRATTYGLAATRQEWARELLLKLEKDDPQWFVRSAATEALAMMKGVQEYALDCSPVTLDRQGWLVEWGATRGMIVGLGRSAEPVLMRALTEADTPVKLAAIHTLAHAGGEQAVEPLRALLASPEHAIRTAAYQALQAISARTGIKIPRA
jgi:HEAT repeat protein